MTTKERLHNALRLMIGNTNAKKERVAGDWIEAASTSFGVVFVVIGFAVDHVPTMNTGVAMLVCAGIVHVVRSVERKRRMEDREQDMALAACVQACLEMDRRQKHLMTMIETLLERHQIPFEPLGFDEPAEGGTNEEDQRTVGATARPTEKQP